MVMRRLSSAASLGRRWRFTATRTSTSTLGRSRFFSSSSCSAAPTSEFDRATALTLKSEDSGDGLVIHETTEPLTDRFSIAGNPNGGLIAALAVSAARGAVPFRDQLSLSGHYVRAFSEGVPVQASTQKIKAGRSAATVSTSLSQDGKERARFLITFGDLAAFDAPYTRIQPLTPPLDLPPPEECSDGLMKGLRGAGFGTLPDRFNLLVPESSPFLPHLGSGKGGGEPRIEGHMSFSDGREPCLRSLCFFNDATPPPVLNLTGPAARWVPTLELSIHFRARPVKGKPLMGRFFCPAIKDGLCTTDGEVYDGDGNLVALSRQLCMVLQGK